MAIAIYQNPTRPPALGHGFLSLSSFLWGFVRRSSLRDSTRSLLEEFGGLVVRHWATVWSWHRCVMWAVCQDFVQTSDEGPPTLLPP